MIGKGVATAGAKAKAPAAAVEAKAEAAAVEAVEEEGGTKLSTRKSENMRLCVPKSWAVTIPLRPLPHQAQRQHHSSSRHRWVTGRSRVHQMVRAASGAAGAAVAAAHRPAAVVWLLAHLVPSPSKHRQRSAWGVAVVRVGHE